MGQTKIVIRVFYLTPEFYKENNPDVVRSGINPLIHFYLYGKSEGRLPAPPVDRVENHSPVPTFSDSPTDLCRILVMDYRIPMWDISAGERATFGCIRDLAALGFKVTFIPADMHRRERYAEMLEALGVEVITSNERWLHPNDYLNDCAHIFATFYIYRVQVAELVFPVIRAKAPSAKVIFHDLDLQFLREKREADIKKDPEISARALRTQASELAVMEQADHTVIVSPAELIHLKEYLPKSSIHVFPGLYVPLVSQRKPSTGRKDIFYLGGYTHNPNVDAVIWFVKEVWPRIRKKLPNINFFIIGSEAPKEIIDLGAEPGVLVIGYVEYIEALLSSFRIGVAPLRFGAGIKGKVALSMGAGLPLVCTSIAAEGMDIENNVHALIAEAPEDFAEAVIDLYTNEMLWENISRQGYNLISRRFCEAANRIYFIKLLWETGVLTPEMYIQYCRSLQPRAVPNLGDEEEVDVSIIIPVYNQWTFTRDCLNSILETCSIDDIAYEIILADDGSTDETTMAEELYPGLRVVRSTENQGFLRNCNRAAQTARGRHLLLLNNDTLVLPGWLGSLLDLMEKDDRAAIVGSKMIYPDGRVQEAGAVLYNDGTAYNCGGFQPRFKPELNTVREVDYISGCSILIRGNFWKEAGGFDERYQGAYCEDCDLALTARAKGMKVIYQPKSEIIHFGGQSYGGWGPPNPLQQNNTLLLKEKWDHILTQ